MGYRISGPVKEYCAGLGCLSRRGNAVSAVRCINNFAISIASKRVLDNSVKPVPTSIRSAANNDVGPQFSPVNDAHHLGDADKSWLSALRKSDEVLGLGVAIVYGDGERRLYGQGHHRYAGEQSCCQANNSTCASGGGDVEISASQSQ